MKGKFIENKLEGKIGLYSEDNLEIIEYKDGVKNGRIIKYFKDRDIYTTSFENDQSNNIHSF